MISNILHSITQKKHTFTYIFILGTLSIFYVVLTFQQSGFTGGKIEVTVAASDGSARRATGGPLLYVADEEDDTVKPGKGNSGNNNNT